MIQKRRSSICQKILKLYYDNSLFEAEARGKSESSRMIYKLLDLVRAGKTDQEILDEVKEATPEDIEEMRSHLKQLSFCEVLFSSYFGSLPKLV